MKKKIGFTLVILIVILQFTVHFIPWGSQKNTRSYSGITQSPLSSLNGFDLPVGIFYDARYSEPWNFHAQDLTNYLNQTLRSYNLTVFVLNATALRNFMNANPFGIVIITMGVAPDTIWNGSAISFVEGWLDNGGIMVWTGCEEFYWVGMETGINIPIGHQGASRVLDLEYLETLSDQYVSPTPLGLDLFTNFSAHSTDVFCSVSALMAANVHFEVYAKSGDYADPVLLQPKDGKGYFVRIHADYNDQVSTQNLSTWISSYIYNRFFKLPIVTESNSINSVFFRSSEQLFINVTNFSEYFGDIYVNSTSDAFEPLTFAFLISPKEQRKLNFSIVPRSSARFQSYDLQINFFSNYTNSQNESKQILFYSKILSISIQVPILIEILEVETEMYPGGTYSLTLNIQKYINASITLNLILICDGCTNELKTIITLNENNSQVLIPFSIQIMAKSGSYKLIIRSYQNDALFSSSDIPIQILSIFENPVFVLILVLLIVTFVSILVIYYYQSRKKMKPEQEILKLNDGSNVKKKDNI